MKIYVSMILSLGTLVGFRNPKRWVARSSNSTPQNRIL